MLDELLLLFNLLFFLLYPFLYLLLHILNRFLAESLTTPRPTVNEMAYSLLMLYQERQHCNQLLFTRFHLSYCLLSLSYHPFRLLNIVVLLENNVDLTLS